MRGVERTHESLPRRLEPLYRPSGVNGEIVVYAGDLAIQAGDEERTVRGQLELRLAPKPDFVAHFAGPFSELHFLSFLSGREDSPTVSVPQGAPLSPPTESALPERPEGASWVDQRIPLNGLEAGDTASVECFIVHVSGALEAHVRAVEVRYGQRQLEFRLPRWNLVLATVDPGSR